MMKKLQIVQVDTDCVRNTDLQIGDNVIGVGVVADCEDEQISKHAMTINVTPSGDMTIKPVVPCYMKSSGSSGLVQLEVGSTTPIRAGDLFSLLSNKHWFKIISVDITIDNNNSSLKRRMRGKAKDEPHEKKIKQNGSVDVPLRPNDNLNDTSNSTGADLRQEDFGSEDYKNEGATSASTTEIATNNIYGASIAEEGELMKTKSFINSEATDSTHLMEPILPNESCTFSECEDTQDLAQNRSSKGSIQIIAEVDKSPITYEDVGKKIKWDCGQHFSDRSHRASANSLGESHAHDADDCTSQNDTVASVASAAVSALQPGRKNSDSGRKWHGRFKCDDPTDSDCGLDERPECHFGIRCYRKNPQHRKEFKHTVKCGKRPQTPLRTKLPGTSDLSTFQKSEEGSEYGLTSGEESSDEQ